MTLSTSVEISYHEAEALYSTVRYGCYYVQENPHRDPSIQLSLRAQARTADRLASRILVGLSDEFEKDVPKFEDEVDGAFLTDARVPDAMNLVSTLLSQEIVDPGPGKKRQLRGHYTGGEKDVLDFYVALKEAAEKRGFDPTFYDLKPFGDVGPIRKLTFGFTRS